VNEVSAEVGPHPAGADGSGQSFSGLRSGRRWSDRPGRVPAITFARFLTVRPTLDEVVRFLVALLSWPSAVSAAFIVRLDGQDLTVLASYDELMGVDGLTSCTCERRREVIRSLIRDGSPMPVLRTGEDHEGCQPMAAWSLGRAGESHDYLVLALASPLPGRVVAEYVMGIPEALALYETALRGRDVLDGVQDAVPRLSERQRRVLQYLAFDLTMQQIADRIGYSESTVRMDSLAIYRALGVHDRHLAAATAVDLGIIDAPSADTRHPDPAG